MSARSVDLLVIGAGPAGIAAATEAAGLGLSVSVMDEQSRPGGQIYRGIETASPKRLAVLGKDYAAGRSLTESFRSSAAEYLPDTLVWNIGSDRSVDFSRGGRAQQMNPSAILVATGALERPMPIPGWTLPGVTTAGALQILLKSSGIVRDNCVLAGAGPLLWLVATQMIAAGARPAAIVENLPRGRIVAGLRHLPGALRAREYLFKGLAMIARVKAAGVPVYANATGLAIEGSTQAEAITFSSGGRQHRIETDAIALHQGVVPNQQITRLVGAEHRWDAAQACFHPVLDARFRTSADSIYVAGDGAAINGARPAALQGRLAALLIAEDQGRRVGTERIRRLQAGIARDKSVRPMLETIYAPAPEILAPADSTLICRCEEVTAGEIRSVVDLGAPGPNQIKSMLRAGMGPCQGRVCGLAVAQIIADRKGETPEETGYYRIRPPIKPITLAELAAYAPDEDAPRAASGDAAA
ncbi:NADPH-dependent 2,4-dienoyl-CoA reductase/sulfur reductase-like enzyme [Hoeflea marina]|uniref:NADPH-dependent 2,4-dienoyl-CoA reductase/sulfur reductase-like enzyme n=1 Tax=Hoeflea marina TaxID=274592 RepID=A0A317PFI2_9HYPH|nr:NAD(P)/FAD-dependent oxidoreductase [Hoeflea marina]PWV98096.1 NADPH-dependent 2,4-dienoyl-CoA reductase/sulfur reductase-like enzyme [Hoeflea marina]